MTEKFTLLQAKKLIQIANGQTNLNLQQHRERDFIIAQIQDSQAFTEYESKVKVKADSYQDKLKTAFDEWNKQKAEADNSKKKNKNKIKSEADIEYQRKVAEIKKELNQDVATLDEEGKDIFCIELDLPTRFIIPAEDYFMYFKKQDIN